MGEKSQETEDTSSGQATALSWVVQERLKPLLDLITDTDVEELSLEQGGVRVAIKRTAQMVSTVSSPPPPTVRESEPQMQVVHAGRVGVFSRSRNQEQLEHVKKREESGGDPRPGKSADVSTECDQREQSFS